MWIIILLSTTMFVDSTIDQGVDRVSLPLGKTLELPQAYVTFLGLGSRIHTRWDAMWNELYAINMPYRSSIKKFQSPNWKGLTSLFTEVNIEIFYPMTMSLLHVVYLHYICYGCTIPTPTALGRGNWLGSIKLPSNKIHLWQPFCFH